MRKILYCSFFILLLAVLLSTQSQSNTIEAELTHDQIETVTAEIEVEAIPALVEVSQELVTSEYNQSELFSSSHSVPIVLASEYYYKSTTNLCQLLLVPLNNHWNSRMLFG